MKFSERYGFSSVRDTLQVESMDEALRNGLWSNLEIFCFSRIRERSGYTLLSAHENRAMKSLCRTLWLDYFKKPIDTLENNFKRSVRPELKDYFFQCEWFEALDFIEFIAQNFESYEFSENFEQACNAIFEREMSAYRFVSNQLSQITAREEIEEIQEAISEAADPVSAHLKRALELLSDRESPDYRNSIKESISAIESLVKMKTGSNTGTLGSLLSKLETKEPIHASLKEAFKKLYGFTSDKDGIRHALLDKEDVDFVDAKLMMVLCTTFANYVEGKDAKER